MLVVIKGDELDSIELVDVDKEEVLDDMRDELPVFDDNGNEIDSENLTDSQLSVSFRKEVSVCDGLVALQYKKLIYVRTNFARYILGVDDLQSSYVNNGVFTIVTWDTNHVFNLEKPEYKKFYTR